MPRFVSPHLEIVVPGKMLTTGPRQMGKSYVGSPLEYYNLIRLITKSVMAENGWKIIKDKPIYIILTVYLGIHDKNVTKQQKKDMYDGKVIVYKTPNLARLLDHYMRALKGVLFEKELQVCSYFAVKKYSRYERVEVLVGVPESVKGLEHDIRNC